MVGSLVSLDGTRMLAAEAQLPAWFVAASQGMAWFETMRVVDGRLVRAEQHAARARRTASALGAQLDERWTDWAGELAATLPAGTHALRAGFFAAPSAPKARVLCEARTLEAPPDPLQVAVVARLDQGDDPLAALKLHARLAWTRARAQAHALGAYDALLVDRQGNLTEGTIGNLLALRGGRLSAPVRGVLPGIGRAAALAAARDLGLEVDEEPLHLDSVARLDALLLVNAVRLCLPVDGVLWAGHLPGSKDWARRLNERLVVADHGS